MGLLKKLLGGQDDSGNAFTIQQSVAAILLVAITSDGEFSDDEAAIFNMAVNRMAIFRNQTPREFDDMIRRSLAVMRNEGPSQIVEKAAAILDRNLRTTAFAVAADLVFSDGIVESDEVDVIEMLHQTLDISDETAVKIIEVIKIKNGC